MEARDRQEAPEASSESQKAPVDTTSARARPTIGARLKMLFGRFRLFARLTLVEARLADTESRLNSLQGALTYCADCRGVLLGVNEKNVIEFPGGKKALFCNFCVQRQRAYALQERRRHARR